jgi:hypothetical protein
MSLEADVFPHTNVIVQLAYTDCLVRHLDALHIEIWGDDISEHYLLCYDEAQPHLLDVFYVPFDNLVERHDDMG